MKEFTLKKFKNPISLIISLGNIGKKYELTRHNSGFLFVDKLIGVLSSNHDFTELEKKEFLLTNFQDLNLIILKPALLMNNSGNSVKEFLKYKSINPENILIVHDDLDLFLGSYKLHIGKSPAKHNGVNSITNHNDINDSYRLRIGIENRKEKIPGIDYVLNKFSKDEMVILQDTFLEIIENEFNV